MTSLSHIHGQCAQGFEAVRAAFANNFAEHDEVGAAISLYKDSEPVVDLWGGHRDGARKTEWTEDTLVNIWSTTKGVAGACYAIAASRGAFSYADKVADYWPEFAAHGKGDVTIGQLLSHQAGLCGFADPAVLEDYYDLEGAAARLAAAEPFWEPGTQAGYHAISIGALASALFKRIEGRYLREFVANELRGALGLDIFIGLPKEEFHRCALLTPPPNGGSEAFARELTPEQIAAMTNPALDAIKANSPQWRAAEVPAANGHATARALGALYGALANDSKLSGKTLTTPDALAEATMVRSESKDAVLGVPVRWAAGFARNSMALYGPSQSAFGHSGWGGAFAFADPDTGIGFAYVMNRMGNDLFGDPRNMALIAAVYEALG